MVKLITMYYREVTMKKLLSVFLILILCFALGACAAPSDDGLEEIENPMTVYISFADAEMTILKLQDLKKLIRLSSMPKKVPQFLKQLRYSLSITILTIN